ncbi:MAG: EAL domain-containing protein [Campylobacterota bacterium]|nr:EAL domain-containing protein [Campylobacterota bacterium]
MENIIYKQAINDNFYVTKTDVDGIITFANKNFCDISGYSKDELIGKSHTTINSNEYKSEFYKELWDTILCGDVWKGVVKNTNKDGDDLFMDTSIYPMKNEDGTIKEFVSVKNDLTHYIELLTFDKLTGLKNRDSMKKELDENKSNMCVIVNIDSFSDINEFYGGYIGDKVIIETAKRLKKIFKGSNIYRLQGDEFTIIKPLAKKYDKKQIEEVVKNKLKSTFQDSYFIDDIEIHLNATSGIHIGDEYHLRNANLAFKDAKLKNKSFSIYTDTMLEQFADFAKNKKIAGDIKTAIKQDQIVPYYQPIIDNKTQEIVKYEALARLIKDDSIIPPGAFIGISKKIKYYHKITRSMLEKGFKNFGNQDAIGISFNLTVEDIANVRTFNYIIELLTKNKNNSNITFELVESDGIEDFDMFDKFIQTVKKFGAKISIDDFGTGYSNFSYLAKIEPDFLKIDGSLIKNIENKKDFDVVKTIVDFAKMYNIKTVAEFVENEDIFILTKELGIDYSQGYYFGKPICIDDV